MKEYSTFNVKMKFREYVKKRQSGEFWKFITESTENWDYYYLSMNPNIT